VDLFLIILIEHFESCVNWTYYVFLNILGTVFFYDIYGNLSYIFLKYLRTTYGIIKSLLFAKICNKIKYLPVSILRKTIEFLLRVITFHKTVSHCTNMMMSWWFFATHFTRVQKQKWNTSKKLSQTKFRKLYARLWRLNV